MIHIIEIREILPQSKPGTVKFKSTANLTYNCNKPEFNGHWAVGEKYKIDFNVSSFQGQRGPVEMKWVNQARFWKDGDGPIDPPEKAPYQGGGGGSYQKSSGGGSMKQSDPERTHDIHKQVAAKCAMDYFVGAGATVDDLAANFGTVADIVLGYIEKAAPKSDDGDADKGSEASADGVPDEEFGF